jgi:hypothetical protein
MAVILLLDADLEGAIHTLKAELEATGWARDLGIEIKRLRDYGMSRNTPDQLVWQFAQQHGFWLLTNNRNNEDETSLQATIQRENTPESLPVITTTDKDRLAEPAYRSEAVTRLIEIVIYPESSLGTGRLFIP